MSEQTPEMLPIVIVGTGLAGYTLAREFRKLDKEKPVIMLTADDGHSYSKPMLSTGFTKKKTADQLSMADPGRMAEQLNIEIRTFTTVTGIDSAEKCVLIGDEKLPYDRLVLAWGADVIRIPLAGDGLEKVFSINDLMDYRKFRASLEGKKRVLIMGAGLIGCEFANDLLVDGYEIDVVAPSKTVLPGLLPEEAAAAVQLGLEQSGVRFHLQKAVKGVESDGDGVEVELDSGESLNADIVVSAVGLRPRTDLAKQAGLDVNRGIQVDRTLAASEPDIYALGDCAEVDGHLLLYVAPLMACARALAKTLANETTSVSYAAMPVVVKTPACPVAVANPPPGVEGVWSVNKDDNNVEALFKGADGELLGFALTGSCVDQRQSLTKLLPSIH